MSKSLSKNFTEGNIWRQLILFSLPFMLSNAFQVLYSAIDMIIVGHYVGTAGLSAVSQSSQIVTFATMLCFGFSNAGQVLVAQAFGAKKTREANDIVGTLTGFVLSFSVAVSIIILIFRNQILNAINIPDESEVMAVEYLVICTAGLIFTAGYNLVSAVLRGMGDAKSPFLFIGIASFVNLVLDLLFTGLLGWGVAGAAWATIIGQAVSFIFSLFYLYRKRAFFGFEFKAENFIPRKKYIGMIASLGTPMAIQSGFINISMLFVNAMINDIGVVESATYGVGIRIDDIINKVSLGIQYAAVPMISQNIGAGNRDRAKSVVYRTWVLSVALTAVFMLIYGIAGRELFMLFSDDPLVHEKSGEFIAAILWMFPALAIMRGTGAFVQGIGNAKLGLILSILDGVALRIGLSYLFGIAMGHGFFGFVLGYGLAAYGYAIPSFIYFISGVWRKEKALSDRM